MLADEHLKIRQAGIDRIKRIRHSPSPKQQAVREFQCPKEDERVETLKDLLQEEELYEPPLTMKLSLQQLEKFAQEPLAVDIPCHSQGVERYVRMVTEASCQVYGMDARDGFIKARIKSRELTPSFQSKHDFYA